MNGTNAMIAGTIHYGPQLGWQIDQRPDGPALILGHDVVAVAIPTTDHVAWRVLDLLNQRDACGPVIGIHAGIPHWLFLADPNGLILPNTRLPARSRLVQCPAAAPLPTPASQAVTWVKPPLPNRRWLPTLAAVVAALQEAAHECPRSPRRSSGLSRRCLQESVHTTTLRRHPDSDSPGRIERRHEFGSKVQLRPLHPSSCRRLHGTSSPARAQLGALALPDAQYCWAVVASHVCEPFKR